MDIVSGIIFVWLYKDKYPGYKFARTHNPAYSNHAELGEDSSNTCQL
jgi:hypothetical protein